MRGSRRLQLTNPQYEILDAADGGQAFQPIVPVTKDQQCHRKIQRKLIYEVNAAAAGGAPILPEIVRLQLDLPLDEPHCSRHIFPGRDAIDLLNRHESGHGGG
jgi:hypothetical protein